MQSKFVLLLAAAAAVSAVPVRAQTFSAPNGAIVIGSGQNNTPGTLSTTRAGDVPCFTGSVWGTLAGNTSGTKYLTEDSSGNCSWASAAGSGTVVGGGGGIVPASGSPSNLYAEQMPLGGRVTLVSGTCVATTDQAAQTTVYYAPCGGGEWLPVYDGTDMKLRQFTGSATDQVGLTLALGSNWAANTAFDVYAALDSGTLVLCTVAWSNSGAGTSARATAVTQYKGVWVNNASATCRKSNSATITIAQYQGTLVGGFLTNSSTGTVDLKFGSSATGGGAACICIWNVYNPARATVAVIDSTATWTYTTATFRQANNSTGNQINVLQGLSTGPAEILVNSEAAHSAASVATVVGIGIDATNSDSSNTNSVPDNAISSGAFNPATAQYTGNLAVGYHTIARLEYSTATGTTTWIGVSAPYKTGLTGKIWY